jgi:uncharacterized membrane protein YeaQ/YmgE (transglycosylase-associated protein family)
MPSRTSVRHRTDGRWASNYRDGIQGVSGACYMGVVVWIVVGALLGAAASVLGNRGFIRFSINVTTSIACVMSGGWLLGLLIGTSAFDPGTFELGSLLVSLLAAAVVLAFLHEFRGDHPPTEGIQMHQFPSQNPRRHVGSAGHTDHVRSDVVNPGLSRRRAGSLKSFLADQGFESGPILASGTGELLPVADTRTDAVLSRSAVSS